ncbi:hypothetical protein ABE527_02625 [Brucella sp. TWI432]
MGLKIEQVQFDHNPALCFRPVNPETGDTIPPANDPEHIDMLLITEHKEKTFGKGGEKRITTAGSDIGNYRKSIRLKKGQEEMRRRMLAKEPGSETPKPRSKWPSRKMRSHKPNREV